ncbi:hypothetical protein COM54_22095 [Bacillus toyonensis]|uniref:hypothetical protein n=1 Tax=Bacillus toyonensis TaxID=155322 RepID=UPI000BF42260|nr:hypothetical protein [Bacillus toyonensis]PGE07854.1 hypothetical protein COM54_22095 [Bacillus toyonensis]
MKKEMEMTLKMDYKGCKIIVDEARKLTAENKELKAKLEAREKSIKHLSEWIIGIGTYAGVDIQRDFDGVFDEDFIQEVATCLEDDILVSQFNLERQDKIIKNQDESIEAYKKITHNADLIITMLTQQLVTKYDDELGKTYLKARTK